jgi:transcription elongation factor GreA
MEKIPMTLNGFRKIQDEVGRLKNNERPQIVNAIAAARSLGDLSENAEYHSAKDRQGIIEARIADLEDKINRAEVIKVSGIAATDIKFGATVILKNTEDDTSVQFQIVGSFEASIKDGLLPVTSPLARALIGRTTGEIVEVSTPGGVKTYKIKSVKYV